MKKWYEELFENSAKQYDKEIFVQGTIGECDFLESEIAFKHACRILDIGCGTGRHSLELARRGYEVTGIDLSDSQLTLAREKANEAGLEVAFFKHDARELHFDKEFDLAIMLCEGAFPLMETDAMNFQILQSAFRALKSGAKFIFTTLNGLFPIYHSTEAFCNEGNLEGNTSYRENKFDPMTFRDHNITTTTDDEGVLTEFDCNERYYIPPEITWLLRSIGFVDIEIFGAKLGAFSRSDPLKTDDFEMLVICRKDG